MVRLTIKYDDKIIAEKYVSKEEFDELNSYNDLFYYRIHLREPGTTLL